MNTANALQYALFLVVITLLVKPAGTYMAHVFNDEHTWFDPILKPIERVVYRLIGINPKEDMTWTRYAGALLIFSLAGTLLLYALLRGQTHLPYYHAAEVTTPMTPDLAMNTAVSFSTTSTWQAYSGESAMTYWSQMADLCAQNFLGGAAGFAVGVAFIRGLARQGTGRIGNFWVDLTRSLLWVLLPIALVGSVALIWQGVPQNFAPYTKITTLEGAGQTIAQGPVAALEFIKNLGTNGGGFFGANGAHPFENPTPLANFIEMLAISVLPAAFTYTFGRMTGNVRQGWTLFGVMVFLFALGTVCCDVAERHNAPQVAALHIGTDGNMEGKEARFGVGASVLDAINTSNTATGSTNSMHDSYTPLGVMIPLINMLLGEIVFGGLGTGLFSIIMIALIGLFISGLMIGRTPEYLGKKIGVNEIKLVMIYTLIIPATVLILSALAVSTQAGQAGLTTNTGAHGFTEIVYAYASSSANNGQSMAGLSANSPFYNITTAIAMMAGRFGLMIPALALAGLLSGQRRRPANLGTLPTDTLLFAVVVVGAALLVEGLSFFPVLSLGPVVEHFAGASTGH